MLFSFSFSIIIIFSFFVYSFWICFMLFYFKIHLKLVINKMFLQTNFRFVFIGLLCTEDAIKKHGETSVIIVTIRLIKSFSKWSLSKPWYLPSYLPFTNHLEMYLLLHVYIYMYIYMVYSQVRGEQWETFMKILFYNAVIGRKWCSYWY